MPSRPLDYRPDLAARRLRSRRNDTIGLIVADIRNPAFSPKSVAPLRILPYQNRMRVILCNADENPDKEALYLDLMRDENIDGVILSPTLRTWRACRCAITQFSAGAGRPLQSRYRR